MIEINLIPDVKLELLRARRQQTNIISISIITAVAGLGVVGLLAFYTFGVQTIARNLADNAIKEQSRTLQQVEDLPKTLTIQQQLDQLTSLHEDKNMTSRIFDFISTAVPTGENKVSISRIALNSEDNEIAMDAEAPNGYEALEVFKKTLAETKFMYYEDGKEQDPVNIALEIFDGDRSYGEDSDGNRVLRFTLSLEYPDELFSPSSKQGRIVGPMKQNATDSVTGVPKSLFTNKPTEDGAQ